MTYQELFKAIELRLGPDKYFSIQVETNRHRRQSKLDPPQAPKVEWSIYVESVDGWFQGPDAETVFRKFLARYCPQEFPDQLPLVDVPAASPIGIVG